MLDVRCDSCQATFRVDPKFAGKRGRCPKCQSVVVVPAETESPRSLIDEARAETPRGPLQLPEILASFHGDIEPVRTTALYRFGCFVVAGMMLLLPVLYILLIAGVVALTGWHAVANAAMIPKLRNIWGILFVYVGPIVVGGILSFFMVKPLFAPRQRRAKLRTLEFGSEPLLFALVTRIARAVGAPEPRRINIDAEVNAMAGLGSFWGSDLTLTIGLPLVAGLTIEQLAGVIAHELGHFSQGAGMRLSNLIRSINYWFSRVVYERDDWDESLARGAAAGDRFSVILYLAMFCVWLSRGILAVLMYAGHAVSGFQSRQMEYDADTFQTRLVGSETYVSTMRRVAQLSIGGSASLPMTVMSFFNGGKLPNDLTELVLLLVDDIPPEKLRELNREMEQVKTGLFDTHPSNGDRIRAARAMKCPGVFHLDRPATELFQEFPRMSRAATRDYYSNLFSRSISRDDIVPTAAFLAQGQDPPRRPFE
ncbi:MAG: M48 family metalloprotease [Gemmataceae bacterium]|nr:M48 family metalloprotease [Gemmataceae bacterium]